MLARRGYGEPEAARTFLEGALPGHDPFLLGDMAAACETIRAAVAAGKRICVHGDYDVDGICATTLAVIDVARAGRRGRVAPAEPLRRGLRRLGRHARPARGRGLRARRHRRLRHHRRRGGRSGEGERARGRRHRPPPARRDAARLPDRRDPAVGVPVPGALRHRRRLQARAGAARRRRAVPRPPPRPRRARDDRRRRPARRREPRARDRGPAGARRARRSAGSRP